MTSAAGSWSPSRVGQLLRVQTWIPVYLAIVVLFVASRWIVGANFASWGTFWTIVALASFVAVVGAGQGFVILTGGIDLSVPWVITLGGILTGQWSQGADDRLYWVLPAVLGVGTLVGVINGLGVAILGISPVVFTIASNVIIEGVVLVTTGGTPAKTDAPPALQNLMHDRIASVPVVVFFMLGFAVLMALLMSKTTFGKRAYAVGNSPVVSNLSGIAVWRTLVSVYALSGLTAALAGVLLTGYSAQSFLSMGDPYLLPSITAVVIGGASIVGGRGHYLGTLGGAIFLSLLGTMIQARALSDALQQIIFGCAILLAVVAVRER